MTILATIGAIVQNCLQTNTLREIIDNALNIYHGYKTYRSIACLTLSLLLGAGLAALFIVEPSTFTYFQAIVLKALPFLGNIASAICVGVIGFWLGGALGFNIAKVVSQEIAKNTYGHSNTAYVLNDDIVGRIIDQNPAIFQTSLGDIENGLKNTSFFQDKEQLKSLLESTRDNIDKYSKTNPALHLMNKNALLSAIQHANLAPLLDLKAYNLASQQVKQNLTEQLINHMAVIPDNFLKTAKKGNSNEEENENIPTANLKKEAVVFSNVRKMVKQDNKGKQYPLNGRKISNNSEPLDDDKKAKLLYELRRTHQNQKIAQKKSLKKMPDKLSPILNPSVNPTINPLPKKWNSNII